MSAALEKVIADLLDQAAARENLYRLAAEEWQRRAVTFLCDFRVTAHRVLIPLLDRAVDAGRDRLELIAEPDHWNYGLRCGAAEISWEANPHRHQIRLRSTTCPADRWLATLTEGAAEAAILEFITQALGLGRRGD